MATTFAVCVEGEGERWKRGFAVERAVARELKSIIGESPTIEQNIRPTCNESGVSHCNDRHLFQFKLLTIYRIDTLIN